MDPIGEGSAPNVNTISRRLDAERRMLNKRGNGETASTSGAHSTSQPRTATRIAELSTTTGPTAGALCTPLIRAALSFLVHVTTLGVATPSARASHPPRRKHLRRRRGAGCSTRQVSQSLRSDTRLLETYLRTLAGYLEPSMASPARELAVWPSWPRKGQSGDWDFETTSPAVCPS